MKKIKHKNTIHSPPVPINVWRSMKQTILILNEITSLCSMSLCKYTTINHHINLNINDCDITDDSDEVFSSPCGILDTISRFSTPVTSIRHLQQVLILVKDFLRSLDAVENLVISADFL